MTEDTPYLQAKVLLAVITLVEYRSKKQADIRSISELSGFSSELTNHLVNKLETLGAVRRITGAFEDRVAILDENAIAPLFEEKFSSNIEDEVAQFAQQQKAKHADINSLFQTGGESKKDLFSSLEEKLKAGGKVKRENPLDAIGKKKDQTE